MSVSRQAYYKQPKRSKQVTAGQVIDLVERALKARKVCPAVGCRTIASEMPSGWPHGRYKTEQLLLRSGFRVRRKTRRIITTRAGEVRRPNLLLGRHINGVNQVWCTDMTYYHTADGKVNYLIFIVDAYSQKIISHGAFTNCKAVNFLSVLKKAERNRPDTNWEKLIHHSDRGSQYGSDIYTTWLKDRDIDQSMSIYSWENPLAEKVNDLIKNRYLVYWEPKDKDELKVMLNKAVKNHNAHGKKQKLGDLSPDQFEQQIRQGAIKETKVLKPMNQYRYKLIAHPELNQVRKN